MGVSVQGSLCPGGLCQEDPTAIRLYAGGTHPTGMHSCLLPDHLRKDSLAVSHAARFARNC